MDYQEDYKNPLNSIPTKKIEYAVQSVIDKFPGCKGLTESDPLPNECRVVIEAIYRYAYANIPVDYWFRDVDSTFKGDESLVKVFNEITNDIHKAYNQGTKLCFAGNHGVGKTLTCACILKKAVETGYSGLYVTLTDIVTLMGSKNSDSKYEARQILLNTDFLVVDEFDPRFMGSDNAAEFYGRILETTLRARVQNTLPLLLCTNSPNVLSSFSGPLKQSIASLMKLVKIIPVLPPEQAKDYRTVVAAEKK